MMKKQLAIATLCLGVWAGPGASAAGLSAAQIRALAPGNYLVSVYGLVKLQVSFQPGGGLAGLNLRKKKRDTGVWYTEGDKLCIRWTRWLKGKTRCAKLSGGNGSYSGGGLSIRKI